MINFPSQVQGGKMSLFLEMSIMLQLASINNYVGPVHLFNFAHVPKR